MFEKMTHVEGKAAVHERSVCGWVSFFFALYFLFHRSAVVFPTHDANGYSDQVFGPALFAQHSAVLLKVVPFSGYEGHALFAVRQTDEHALPIRRVGLFGLFDQRFQHDSFQMRGVADGSQFHPPAWFWRCPMNSFEICPVTFALYNFERVSDGDVG